MGSEYSLDEVTPYSKSFSVFGLKYSSIRIILKEISFFQCVITCATLQFDINLFQLVEIWCALWMNVQDYTLLRDKLFHGSVMLQETFAVVGLVYPDVLKLSKKCSKC